MGITLNGPPSWSAAVVKSPLVDASGGSETQQNHRTSSRWASGASMLTSPPDASMGVQAPSFQTKSLGPRFDTMTSGSGVCISPTVIRRQDYVRKAPCSFVRLDLRISGWHNRGTG